MKTYKIFVLAIITFFCVGKSQGQTAEEVIGKYINAIGGKEKISQISSLYTESKMAVMGMEIPSKTTILNGKGMKQEMEVMGSSSITCCTDKGGWSINPMAGGSDPVDMPAEQYNMAKSQMQIGAPFINYIESGLKVELLGKEQVGSSAAFKIKLTRPDNSFSTYYFDSNTYYLIKSVQKGNMQGQEVEMENLYSNFKKLDFGYTMPFTTKLNTGQMEMESTVTKAEVNNPVDPAIFNKP